MIDKKQIEEPVASELKQFREEFASSLQSDTPRLQAAIEQILAYSGKHVRPLLVLLTAKTCGQITRQTIDSAVMLELMHTSSLVHDDVIDETKQRRGVPSLNAIFDNRVSVLVGDYILSSALIRSAMTNDIRVIHIIADIGRALAEGEIKQLETAEDRLVDENQYLDVIRKKTAALLAGCTEIGAISTGISADWIEKARLFGEYMGMCFQIKDDIFDYYQNTKIGKPTGNDIREGKVTLPLLYALRQEEKEGGHYYKDIILNHDLTVQNIDALIAFAKEKGGIEYAEKVMNQYRDKAINLLSEFPESPARNSLLLLADYIIQRNK